MIQPVLIQCFHPLCILFSLRFNLSLKCPEFIKYTIVSHSADRSDGSKTNRKKIQSSGDQVLSFYGSEHFRKNYFQTFYFSSGFRASTVFFMYRRVSFHNLQLPDQRLLTGDLLTDFHILTSFYIKLYHSVHLFYVCLY